MKELPKKTHFDPGQQLSLTAAPTNPPLKRQASPTPLRELIQMFLTEVSYITRDVLFMNTIKQLFLFVEQVDQLEVCLPYSRLLTGIPILSVFQNLRWNSNKTTLKATNWVLLGGLKQNTN